MDIVAGNKPKKRKLEKQLGLAVSPSSDKSAMSAQEAVLPYETPRASAQRDDERGERGKAVAITSLSSSFDAQPHCNPRNPR